MAICAKSVIEIDDGWLFKWPMVTALQRDLKAELGERAYAEAWQRGKNAEMEATLKQLLAECDVQ